MSYHCIRVYAECTCMFSPTRQAYASVCPFIIIVLLRRKLNIYEESEWEELSSFVESSFVESSMC